MRRTPLLTLAATAALAALPAGAQETRIVRTPRAEAEAWFANENRAAIGVSTTATGTLRDTLGLMITNITRGGPAERAGLEEGNRIQAINGVSLRANAADIEDSELSGALSRRLTRELGKAKPGDEVELRIYKEGRTQAVRVKTVDSDSLFRRREAVRFTRAEADERPTLGISIQSSGSRRDTLGVLIVAVGDSTPAERAGLEEGNRIAAINGVNLRVAREDAGDPYLSSAKAQRLQREIAQLKPGSEATLRVYSNGQFRDVRARVARAGDLPRRSRSFFGGGMGLIAPMPPMPTMPTMPAMPGRVTMPRVRAWPAETIHMEFGPAIEEALHEAGAQLERVGPQVEHLIRELPRALREARVPNVIVDVEAPRIRTVTTM
jgi:serine protease Do